MIPMALSCQDKRKRDYMEKTRNKRPKKPCPKCGYMPKKGDSGQCRGCGLKRCGRCGEYKSLDKFNKSTRDMAGLRGECKDCQKGDAKPKIYKGICPECNYLPKLGDYGHCHCVPPKKRCSRCGEFKDLKKYHVCKRYKDGLQYICNDCSRGDRKKRNYTACPKCGYLPQISDSGHCHCDPLLKRCSICQKFKPFSEYQKNKPSKDGLRHFCKECAKEYAKKQYDKHLEKVKARVKRWSKDNPEKLKGYRRKHRVTYRTEINEYRRKYYKANAERERKRSLLWSKLHASDETKEQHRRWLKDNPEKVKEHRRKQEKRIPRKLRSIISGAIRDALAGKKKSAPTFKLLGYTLNNFIAHIEAQFTEGMSWGNFGRGADKWNIEHLIPVSLFFTYHPDDSDRAVIEAWQLDNLRPMWEKDHKEKTKADIKTISDWKKVFGTKQV